MGGPSQSDVQSVIDVISRNNATIIKVTDLYIEGEVSQAAYSRLRKDLGFRKVVYSLVRNSAATPLENIEEVGTTRGPLYGGLSQDNSTAQSIRFRVYR